MFSENVHPLWNTPEIENSLRYRNFKKYLDELRFPELSELRKQLQKTLSTLNVPRNAELLVDPFFEKEGVTLQLHASTFALLKQQMMSMNSSIENNAECWEQLFQLTE